MLKYLIQMQGVEEEVVSPILEYEDIPDLQQVVRELRYAGGKVNSSCGIHVHINASPHTPKTLKNIVNIIASKEDLLYKALQVDVRREDYCKKMDTAFLERLNQGKITTMKQVENKWYEGYDQARNRHYHDSRYHGLNLHAVFSNGTIEF